MTSELQLQTQLRETIVETNASPSNSFHLYFHLLSNVFYLIGSQSVSEKKFSRWFERSIRCGKIFTSIKYEEEVKLLWFDRTLSENVSRLNPVIYGRSGHIAFVYELDRTTSCCSYFAVFTKTGRTQTFFSIFSFERQASLRDIPSLSYGPLFLVGATDDSILLRCKWKFLLSQFTDHTDRRIGSMFVARHFARKSFD